MAKRQGGLGKYGVDAIFSELKEDSEGTELNLDQLSPNPFQPRSDFDQEKLDELAQSIKEHGIIQPIVVRHVEGKYQIVAGERRWRAAQIAGLEKVPVVVKEMDDASMMQMALIENVQREDLNPMEEALAYKRLMEEFELKQDEVASRVGKSRSAVANSVRLLNLPEEVQNLVSQGNISSGHARALLGLASKDMVIKLAERIVSKGLSVRQVEEIIKDMHRLSSSTTTTVTRTSTDPNITDLEDSIQKILGTKVKMVGSYDKGKIEINYHSSEDLDRLIELIRSLENM